MNSAATAARAEVAMHASMWSGWDSPEAARVTASNFVLGHDEIHVWGATLDLPAARLASLGVSLSDDERGRAERFRFDRDRNRFIAARGLLRVFLGRYLDIAPDAVRFVYACACGSPRCRPEHRKPALSSACGDWLRFNISHADDVALFTFARSREVGVDLERAKVDRSLASLMELAAAFFTPREFAELSALPAQARHSAFFSCWTRKESYIKARGRGLSDPLDRFAVPLTHPGHGARIGTLTDPQGNPWSLFDLVPGNGYVAALAASGADARVRCRLWPP